MIMDEIITKLSADSTFSGLVSGPITLSVLPRGYVLPCVCIHRYGMTQDYQFSGPTDTTEEQFQFDVYAADGETAQSIVSAIRHVFDSFTGRLTNYVVQACYLERNMDMPFLAKADTQGIAFRSLLGYRVISVYNPSS